MLVEIEPLTVQGRIKTSAFALDPTYTFGLRSASATPTPSHGSKGFLRGPKALRPGL